ncbi:hypothetical protein R6Q59_007709 [Mikania micrantha]
MAAVTGGHSQTAEMNHEDFSVNDPFLNLFCFHNDDEDDVELNVAEDLSESEKYNYNKDVEDGEDYEDEDYKAEIFETNPSSTVEMVVITMPNGEIYFSHFYICLKL